MMSNLIDQKSESEESGEDSVDHILNLRPKIIAKRRLKGINSNSPTKTDSFDNVIEVLFFIVSLMLEIFRIRNPKMLENCGKRQQ